MFNRRSLMAAVVFLCLVGYVGSTRNSATSPNVAYSELLRQQTPGETPRFRVAKEEGAGAPQAPIGQVPEQTNPAPGNENILSVHLANEDFEGDLFINQSQDNPCCSPLRSGFRKFAAREFPERNLFLATGWNFEHVFSGVLADLNRNVFTPRIDPCVVVQHSAVSASLIWPKELSSWDMTCEMNYTLAGNNCMDIAFTATPSQDCFKLGYVGFMWASYVAGARERAIRFWGLRDSGEPNLLRYGLDWPNGVRGEMGNIVYLGVADLPYEPGIQLLNVIKDAHLRFILPFYYCMIDGDGNPLTSDDTMVFIMMFDQADPVRFSLWNFSNDTQNPAWDWEYIAYNPQPNQTYGYSARCVYKRFISDQDVLREYVGWVKSRGTPVHTLSIAASPPEAGKVFPQDTEGTYAEGGHVYFGIIREPGWVFDHWEGKVNNATQPFTGVTMSHDQSVTAVFQPAPQALIGSWQHEPVSWDVLFRDDFEGGVPAWDCTPAWRTVNDEGNTVLSNADATQPISTSLKSGNGWSGYRVSVRLKLKDGVACLHYRQGPGGCYILELSPQSTTLSREPAGSILRAVATAAPIEYDQWHVVTIAGIQNEIKTYLDGSLIMAYTDDQPIVSGTVNLLAMQNSHALFDDVLIERPTYTGSVNTAIDGRWCDAFDPGVTCTFSGGVFEKPGAEAVFVLDDQAEPKHLDFFVTKENFAYVGYWRHGIYQCGGDTMIIASNVDCLSARPAAPHCDAHTYVSVFTPAKGPSGVQGKAQSDTGSLTVAIEPEGARIAGARWRVDGGAWQGGGVTLTGLTQGEHRVEFKDVPVEETSGCFQSSAETWTTPASQTVAITPGETTTPTGVYVVRKNASSASMFGSGGKGPCC